MKQYIDNLLKKSESERTILLDAIKLETRKHIFNGIYTMTEELGLDKIEDYEERLRLKWETIQAFPDVVFWDHAEHISKKEHIKFKDTLVSTNGDILALTSKGRLSLMSGEWDGGNRYRTTSLSGITIRIHRVVASTFVIRDESLADIPYGVLKVDHKDGNFSNNKVDNIRWIKQQVKKVREKEEVLYPPVVTDDNVEAMNEYVLTLLSLPKASRAYMIGHLDRETREDVFDKVHTLTAVLGLDKIDSHEERVRLRWEYIQANPDKVHWDYPEYVDRVSHSRIPRLLLSTRGDTIIFSDYKGNLSINSADWEKGNKYRGLKIDDVNYRIHRAVGCTFIEKPAGFAGRPYQELVVNHIDLNKANNHYTNLEWVSTVENVRHGLGYESYQEAFEYYLLTVLADNGFKGRRFVLHRDELGELTLTNNYANAIATGRGIGGGLVYKGFTMAFIKTEDIDKYHRGVPEDIKALFLKNQRFFKTNVKPVLGTVLEGPYAGYKFSFIGERDWKRYFNSGRLGEARATPINKWGCRLEPCTLEEAIRYYDVLTEEIINTLPIDKE